MIRMLLHSIIVLNTRNHAFTPPIMSTAENSLFPLPTTIAFGLLLHILIVSMLLLLLLLVLLLLLLVVVAVLRTRTTSCLKRRSKMREPMQISHSETILPAVAV